VRKYTIVRVYLLLNSSTSCESKRRREWTTSTSTLKLALEAVAKVLWLKPATMNRALMSLKRNFAWVTKVGMIQSDPASALKFVPKEAPAPRQQRSIIQNQRRQTIYGKLCR
jgi:site-specific recombinase XerD